MEQKRGQWASNLGFILAAAGSAVGLGNIWKFPGKVGANGGGTFIVTYLIIIFLIGLTVMLAELSLGRYAGCNIVGAFAKVSKKWKWVGGLGVLTAFVIVSYYSVVGGWVMKYITTYLTGANFGGDTSTFFTSFVGSATEPLLWHIAFMVLVVIIIMKGVAGGIEKIGKIFMPILFILLGAIAIRSITLPGASEGLKFIFTFNVADFTPKLIIDAIGQAFFSLSLGMSIMITYGSYVPKKDNLAKSAGIICTLDTLVAIIAAFAIIPAVFATGTDLGMGGAFAFISLPNVFSQMPGGTFFGLLFFVLLFFAAFTSAISILEGVVAYVSEEFKINRKFAIFGVAGAAILLGAGYSLSQGAMDLNLPWFDFANGLTWEPMGNVLEKFTDNLTLPLGALFTCIFVGWIWKSDNAIAEVEQGGKFKFAAKKIWSFSVKYLSPIALIIILLYTLGTGVTLS